MSQDAPEHHRGGIVHEIPAVERIGWYLDPKTGRMTEMYQWQRPTDSKARNDQP